MSIQANREDRVSFGVQEVDLSAVEQIVEPAQSRAMAQALVVAKDGPIDGQRTMAEVIEAVMAKLLQHGLEALYWEAPAGDFAEFRGHELCAFLNRLRTLEVRTDVD